jgi:predicted Zn-dependent peptidase
MQSPLDAVVHTTGRADRARTFLALVTLLLAQGAWALHLPGEGRRTKARDFSVKVDRVELPNGLVVLLAPDPSAASVLVWMTFRAGTTFEPAGRSGMAHLVEHVMATGPTPATDYAALLERRGGRDFNAHTDFESMRFEVVVPPSELPAALWVDADRLGSMPKLIDAGLVERNRRVVLQERAVRDVDAPYGLVREHLFNQLFAAPHPLHGSVIGVPAELAKVSAEDVASFVTTYLVPANAVLTLVGNFDPAQARALVENGLGRLPGGVRAKVPSVGPLRGGMVGAVPELVSREPRVMVGWRVSAIGHDDSVALGLGTQLLTFSTDGAFGMRLSGTTEEDENETFVEIDLTVPYDETVKAVQDDLEGFLRELTHREMQFDLFEVANLALDRSALFDLSTLEGRAARLCRLERLFKSKVKLVDDCTSHWTLDPVTLRDIARTYLHDPKIIIHARPTRPRPARLEP